MVRVCGPERAADLHRLTQLAFAPYAALDPPSGAVAESLEKVGDDLAAGGGAVAARDDATVGCLRWTIDADGDFYVYRVAVDPAVQRAGVGSALMDWAEAEALARGCANVSVGVRIALPGNRAFYEGRRYVVTGQGRHDGYDVATWLSMRKPVA